jgi:hypothetical protein
VALTPCPSLLRAGVLVFCGYNKYLRESTYKEKRFISAHTFRGFHLRSCDFGPVVAAIVRAKVLTSWLGSEE